MAEFERGLTFLDKKSSNIQGTKPKYFIAMNNANYEDDIVVCFVMNTEHNIEKYKLKCNKHKGKFILQPSELSFVTEFTSIMLKQPVRYTFYEIINSKTIKMQETAPELMQREIKNCIDFGYIYDDWAKLIKDSFK